MDDSPVEALYDLQLNGEGLNLSRKIRPDVARSIMNLVMGGKPEPGPDSAGPPAPSGSGAALSARSQGRPSLREYLDDCGAVRYPDKITAIGNYLIEVEGSADFGRDEVKSRFRAAGEAPPGNYPRDFNLALRAGWVAEDANSSGRFYVTQKGRAAIAAKFSSEVKKARTARAKKSRRRASTDAGDGEAE